MSEHKFRYVLMTNYQTVVAMPAVGWTPGDFWKYWAISLPLTIAVLAVWQIWIQLAVAGKWGKLKQAMKLGSQPDESSA